MGSGISVHSWGSTF